MAPNQSIKEFKVQELVTIKQFAEKYPAFSEASLRYLIFESKPRKSSKGEVAGNGVDVALRRVGRRIYIVPAAFFAWVDTINGKGRPI